MTLAAALGGILFVASLPLWLPPAIVALRTRIFTRINGDEGIAIPGPLVDSSLFLRLYAHPAARGRSRGAALSDLFWYWLSPGAEMHQEHIEDGERYAEVARATRHILAVSKQEAEELARRCFARIDLPPTARSRSLVRLRDWIMPAWAEFYYELVFRAPCPPAARDLIVANANDVVTALKCTGLRHMARRDRLTQFLVAKLLDDKVPQPLPDDLSLLERAFYLQGTFFNTAIVQSSEAMAHLFLALARHEHVQAELVARPDDDAQLERAIDETLRMFPLFGISHRITTADIHLDAHGTIPNGSILCFNHLEYHRSGFEDPDRFDPGRWKTRSSRDATFIPYGVAGNRPCPAAGLAPIALRAAARALVTRFAFYSSASHTRSIPNRGPCLVVARNRGIDPRRRQAILAYMRVRDRWEDVWRSVVQLILGSYMVWDARRLKLCRRYFEAIDGGNRDPDTFPQPR